MVVYYAVQHGLMDGLSEVLPNVDTTPLELTAAVLIAIDSPSAAARWLAGDDGFAGAHFCRRPHLTKVHCSCYPWLIVVS